MISFNIPLLMVVAFLLSTLIIGLYYSRKTTSFREYAVGDKRFPTATLVATVLATLFSGGGLIRNVEQFYDKGIYWIILVLVNGLSIWVFSQLVLRMGPFMHHLSMAESIGSIYGRIPRVITALFAICSSVIAIAVQIIVISRAIGICMDKVNPQAVTIFATLILIFYSAFGGVRAVALTDVFQLATFTIIIPILAWFLFEKIDNSILDILSFLQSQPKFQFGNLFQLNIKLVAMLALYLTILMPDFSIPATMQRVYMSSDPIQARRVWGYAALFTSFILVIIVMISLFVFVGAPDMPVTAVWNYIMCNIPSAFKGCVAISLLAMAMSTADSFLNACSVMINHDILGSLRQSPSHQMWLVRLTTFSLGIFAMVVAFFCNDLLEMFMARFDFSIPIITAPFLLALYGFRGTTRTALIGMASGVLTILIWNKWIKPATDINGAFIAMLANGIAMMTAHHLLPQPEGTGWVGPDDYFKQVQQAKARGRGRIKEKIKDYFLDIKENLAKLNPSNTALIWVGIYVIITTLLTYFIVKGMDHIYRFISQFMLGICFVSYGLFARRETFYKKRVPSWVFVPYWLIGLVFCLPVDTVWHWWYGTNLLFTIGLSLAHLAVTLLALPLYLGISILVVTILIAMYLSPIYCMKPLVLVISPAGVVLLLLLVLGLSLLIFSIFIYHKHKTDTYFNQVVYLKGKEELREAQKLKEAVYNSTAVLSTVPTGFKGIGSVLEKIVGTIEQFISLFGRDTPIYKQDFQSIINKFHDWMTYFKKKDKAKDHMLLEATKITLDKLISKLDFALSQEVARPPRLFMESIDAPNGTVPSYIIGDVNQVLYLLVKAVLAVMDLDSEEPQFVRLQFYATHLKFEKSAPIEDNSYPSAMFFRSMALVLSNATTPLKELPTVEPYYEEVMDDTRSKEQKIAPPSIDLRKETISSIVHAHYGYLAYPTDAKQKTILLVLPTDVTAIRNEMLIKLPIDCLMSETAITPKEQADSLMVLMDFHDFVAKLSHEVDPIDLSIISGILQLLRERFGFKRHACGQLFYVRAVGIARLVTEWLFHSPKPIYASLLYGLVRNTCLPLSYIKKNYNLGVYVFVQNVLGVDNCQAMESSLLYVQNRFDKAIAQEQVQLSVLFIKLAERLYDLRHCQGYSSLEEVKYMAKETLTIDIKLASHYLDPEIAGALEKAAKQALKICKDKTH